MAFWKVKKKVNTRPYTQAVLALRLCLLFLVKPGVTSLVMPIILLTGDKKGNDQLLSVLS